MNPRKVENGLSQIAPAAPSLPQAPSKDAQLFSAAQKLEAGFLAEMLRSGGLGKSPEGFGGGAGEDQFASFLLEAQATQMVRAGGIGLAQSLFEAMKGQHPHA